MTIREGGQGGHFADQTDNLFAAAAGVGDVANVRIEGRQRGHSADEHTHGVGVVMEAVHELADILVKHGVAHHAAVPLLELFRRRQVPIQQEVGYFQEGAFFRELLDGVAAIA